MTSLSQQEAFEDSHGGGGGKIWKYAQCAKIGGKYYPVAIFSAPSYVIDLNKRFNNIRSHLKISSAELNNRLHLAGLYALEKDLEIELTPEQIANHKALAMLAELQAKSDYKSTLFKVYLAIGNEADFIDHCTKNDIPEADYNDILSNLLDVNASSKEDRIILYLNELMGDRSMHVDEIKAAVEKSNIASWAMVAKVASNANYSSNDPKRGYWRRLPLNNHKTALVIK